jgi:hypothetical protein
MIPQMTNEQFALWIASAKYSISYDVIKIADRYYEWLESKHSNSGYDIFEAMQAKQNKTKDSDNIHDANDSANSEQQPTI